MSLDLDAWLRYYPIFRNNARAGLIFDMFSTSPEFNAPIKQHGAKNFIWIFKMLYRF